MFSLERQLPPAVRAYNGYAPTIAAGPPSRQYAAGPSHPNVRPAGAATHPLVEKSSGYPVHSAGEYEGSGRANMRPVAMAPPPRERVVVDEFDREYYEPAPPPRPQQPVMESVTYDPNLAYERPASRLHQELRYEDRYGSQAPQPVYDDEEIVYRRTSPMFARRVVTQPEYVTREYADYPRREFSARPPPSQYPVAAERGYIVEGAAPVPGYVTRASTVRPPEAARYEAPPPGRYVERVGSVRPPDAAVYQGYAGGPEDGPRIYGGPARGVPEGGAYIDDRRGPHEVVREYSIRPESHVVVHREYSARPRPASAYYTEQAPYAMGGPPAQEYAYSDERAAYQ
ncbi:hypothetical protein SPBR_09045 [Sporothrix brasiliensis 5110]|uniref:Uncharacterized protein n=1 Tax=Sporothrix brasiliensis 5110 TaxID=1398154 RepID=A0A0C2IYY1_9PEZI|nr:uncharacterized protein SPBR_09045 [Sporothrix brasiliensis 5110]KIH90142.1 hypothetical protein SPBR_09045 [Sporothrix brasiliensis 5110]